MRRSRTATATLTGLIGLVAFFGLASPADADISTQSSNKSMTVNNGGSTGGTTGGMVITNPQKAGPKPTVPDMDIVIPAGPVGPPKADFDIAAAPGGNQVMDPSGDPSDPCAPFASCPQDGECTLGTIDPDCPRPQDDDCIPSTTNVPNPDCPPPGDDCLPIPGAADPDCPPEGECIPSTTNVPNPDCPPEDGCLPIPGAADPDCPKDDPCDEDRPTVPRSNSFDPCDDCFEDDGPGQAARNGGRPTEDPCDPCIDTDRPDDGPTRNRGDGSECCPTDEGDRPDSTPRVNGTTGGTTGGGTSATTGDRPGGTDGDRPNDRPEDCGGTTTGGTDGTTGDSRLPKTGAELMTYAAAGLGLTGIGFGLKRLGRKVA